MLYLDTLENLAQDKTQNRFAISHEAVAGLRHLPELTPAAELLQKWEGKQIVWDEFQRAFKAQLRAEYRKDEQSRLKGLAKYCLANEVTLYSPEPAGAQTYRAILAEVINSIWERNGEPTRAIDRGAEPVEESPLAAEHRTQMEEIADKCQFFQAKTETDSRKSCLSCEHLDARIYTCPKIGKPVIDYKWSPPPAAQQQPVAPGA